MNKHLLLVVKELREENEQLSDEIERLRGVLAELFMTLE